MAKGRIPGDPGSEFDSEVYSPEDFLSNGTRQLEGQHLWPRSKVRTWTVMLFFGTCLLFCARMAMPICVVTMATTFHWSKTESGMVLGGFFWGYCFTQILGGHVSDRVGGERVLSLAAASWALITAATPLLAQLGTHPLAVMTAARFLMGLLQGVHHPALASLCSQRIVEGERGFLLSTMSSGRYLGTLLAGGLGSLMLEWYGWESFFYGTGLLSGLWALTVWQCLLRGQVTPKQVLFSHRSLGSLSRTRWLKYLKRPPVWSMVFAHMCFASTSYTMSAWLPTFFKDTFPHAKGWVYNVIPWLVAVPSALFGGYASDFLIKQGYAVASVRKTMQLLAMGGSSVFLLFLCEPTSFRLALTCISASMGLGTFSTSGVSVNVQDLAPSCAGALFAQSNVTNQCKVNGVKFLFVQGFMNMCGAFMGLVLVSLSGYLIEVTSSWATVFIVITLVNVTGLCCYLVFGDASRVDLEDYSRVTHP